MSLSDLLHQLSLGGIDPLAALVGVSGVAIAIWSLAYARRVAKAQRVFESPQLVVEILDDRQAVSPINGMGPGYIFAVPFSHARIGACMVPLPIAIKNLGEKTADALELYIEIPPALNFPTDIFKATMTFLDGSIKGMSMRMLQNGQREVISLMGISIPSLNPGQHAVVRIPLFFTKHGLSPLKTEVRATTKDKVNVILTVAMRFTNLLKLSFSARDTPMYGKTWSIEVVDAADDNQLELLKTITNLHQMKVNQDIDRAIGSNRFLKTLDRVCPWARPSYQHYLKHKLVRRLTPQKFRVLTAEWDEDLSKAGIKLVNPAGWKNTSDRFVGATAVKVHHIHIGR